MLGLLIILIAMGIGFGSGYGLREMKSRRRRRAARGDVPAVQPQQHTPPLIGAGREDLINLEGLLVAANAFSGRRRASRSAQQVDPRRQPDEFDGAVRDLLGELNRRTPAPSPQPARQ
ncbi:MULTISPECIES: hypothetical protein [unclassified Bradyrhizobium]|uniref:hypothetical protein n=1 Tax=unclassified Bradyrhizobium TaxID=2631580 RepID=UPI0024783513|nr:MULTISPECIES: hypothetical protein [unclassified Bradyrhizobium]WGS19544.1 hypothetical protein MTX22_35080 [Bradyrhizobium sp. ISRA463]WGS26382.1 hypothetical protein MTX19_32560 [Bradyrhizobium sp. ISRA464]